MLINMPEIYMVIVDIIAWFIIHLSVAYLATILPLKYINVNSSLFTERKWENSGKIYEKYFLIKKWKEFLPDGAALFKSGFKKKRIIAKDKDYFLRFYAETCRGELAHWIVILFSPVFFIWNYQYVGCIMIAYAFAANLPCIITQRYNRIRLKRRIV